MDYEPEFDDIFSNLYKIWKWKNIILCSFEFNIDHILKSKIRRVNI